MEQKKRGFSIKKIVLIVLTIPIFFVLVIAASALTLTAIKEPVFVNKDLVMQSQLRVPELLQPRVENGEKVFDLTIQKGQTQFLPGQPTETIGFNGSYLGPTIRAHKDDKVRMNVTNRLDDSATAHWHGMELPAAMDGNAHQLTKPGENWQPHWTITNQAAPLWYHSHMADRTGEQVYRGLAGTFIIDDANSDSLNLPKDYGTNDIPLIVQDRKFDQNNQLIYEKEQTDILGHTGMHGDKILVNGTYAPYTDVPAGQVRLRLVNGSNARRYNFGFEDNRAFYQIATDGGFLAAPVSRNRVMLAPGERAEIVVDLTNGTEPLTLISDAVHEENFLLRSVRTLLRSERDENQVFKIIELRPQATDKKSEPLPQRLNTIPKISAGQATTTRKFVLDAGSQTINGKKMDHFRIDQIVRSGSTEIWEINDQSGVFHPFHIHGVQFQILDRNGRPPEVYERGWKDTVHVANAEIVRVIMRFSDYNDSHAAYMFHCHILEHEDMGMMGQFVTVSKDTRDEDIKVQSKLTESEAHTQMHDH